MAKNIKGRKFVATAASAALVASAIVPVASAAEFADQSQIASWAAEAVAHAVEKGYMQGDGSNFNPKATITKAEVATVIFNALGLEEVASGTFTDVPASAWYAGEVNALQAAGIVEGSDGKFEPTKPVTLAEAAQMVVKALKLEGTADLSKFDDAASVPTWANKAIQALVANGYIKGATTNGELLLDANGSLSRERFATFFVAVAVDIIEEETSEVVVEGATVVDINKVEVSFKNPVDTSKATIKFLKGLANYNITVAWNEEKTKATLTTTLNKIPAGDYTVTVSGLTEKDLTTAVKVEEEKATSVDVVTKEVNTLSSGDTAIVYANVLNQYGTQFTTVNPSDLNVVITESLTDVTLAASNIAAAGNKTNGNVQFTLTPGFTGTGKIVAGDEFKVVAVYKGLTTTGTVKFTDAAGLTQLSFGTPKPLQNKNVITVNETGIELPYTAVDQYGKELKLKDSDLSSITWNSSDNDVVNTSTLSVDNNGKLTFNAGTKAGTAIVTGILRNGSIAQFNVTVEATEYSKTVQLAAPTTVVAANDDVVELPIVVSDQFGNVRDLKKVTDLTFVDATGATITSATLDAKKGVLKVAAIPNKGTQTVTVKSGTTTLATVSFSVEEAAVATTITNIKFSTLLEVGASDTLELADLTVKDQYGRDYDATSLQVALPAGVNTSSTVTLSGETFTATAAGTQNYVVTVDNNAATATSLTLTAIPTADIVSYELAAIPTMKSTTTADAVLVGKNAAGQEVVLKSGKISKITVVDSSVVTVSGTTITAAYTGGTNQPTEKSTVIRAWAANGTLLGETTVTVSTLPSVLTTIVENTATIGTVADIFVSKDQYNQAIDEAGTWYFTSGSTSTSVTTDTTNLTASDLGVAAGEYTVKFVSTDGNVTISTTVTVQ